VARHVLVIAFWIGVWQLATVIVDQGLLLASPREVLVRLVELAGTSDLWGAVGNSCARIGAGIVVAVAVGALAAALSAAVGVIDALVTPLAGVIRSTPVVSFIVLVLIWAGSDRLSFVISFLMAAPIIYANVREGIRHRDRKLLEVAAVFDVPALRRFGAVDVPAVMPYLIAGCRVGVGLAWKSGVAAEVIGLPDGSLGERLYEAKIFLSTADLLAWTIVIVLVSFASEKLLLAGLRRVQGALARGATA
jgi:NitT/TauT family transport system permease protein